MAAAQSFAAEIDLDPKTFDFDQLNARRVYRYRAIGATMAFQFCAVAALFGATAVADSDFHI